MVFVIDFVFKLFEGFFSFCGFYRKIAVEGKQDFSVYKPITKLAELTAEYAVRIAEGEKISDLNENLKTINNNFGDIPVLWLEPQIVNKTNMDEVIINSGFHTYGEVYRERQ